MRSDPARATANEDAGLDPKQFLRVRLWTAVVFALAVLLGAALIGLRERSRIVEARSTAAQVASIYAHAIQERLSRSLSATYALAAVIDQGNGRIENFEQLGQKMMSVYGGIAALQLAPGGIIAISVPRAGNEKALGHNLLEDTARNKEARLALATGELTLAGPFELLQGGVAVIGRLPVFLPAGDTEKRFWGFATALIRIPDLIKASDLGSLSQQGYRYRLWRIHPDRGDRQVIAGTDDAAWVEPVEIAFDVPNGKWTLSVEPVAGWRSAPGLTLAAGAVLTIAALLALVTHVVLMQPLRLRREVLLRTRELQLANQSLEGEVRVRKASEAGLQLAASVFTHAREGILITDSSGTIVEVNETFSGITGFSREDAVGQNPRILNSGRQGPEYYAAMWQALASEGHWSGEVWNRRKNGEVYAELLTISAVRDENGFTRNYVGLFTDVTQIKAHQQRLEYVAHFDALTNLPNRVLLADRLQQAVLQSERRGRSLAVAYLDLDGFKAVNDKHGHSVGDQLLIALAQQMKAAMREGDTLARIGGDEFVAVLGDLEHAGDCEPVLDRLLQAAASRVGVGELELQVSASMGATLYPEDGADVDLLLRHADQAMYQAKQAGKNRYHLFDIAQDAAVQDRRANLDRIRQALEQGQFELFYQPKVNMRSGDVVGVEALIRWRHPARGLLMPEEFLPVVEDNFISIELGEWVIEEALLQIGRWQEAGMAMDVSVNVGARQLQQGGFVARLEALLARHPEVAPSRLELEILETSALEDIAWVSDVMRGCRALGVRFAIDDFGTGYSSLTYLKRLPADVLKIDQSFVRDMIEDGESLVIVKGIIGLAAAFNRQVIAEGVESQVHGARLLSLGCELAQGFGIARPMPAREFPAWVEHWGASPMRFA